MNESFNLQRLGALFVRYWAEWKVVLMLYAAVFVLAMFAIFWYHLIPENNFPAEGVWALVGGIGFAIFLAWQMQLAFYELNHRKQSALFVLLPSSALEKYLFLLVMGFLLPTVAYAGMTYLIDHLTVWMMEVKSPDYFWDENNWRPFITNAYMMGFIGLVWFSGFLVFRRSHLLFSLLAYGLFVFVLIKAEIYLTAAYSDLYVHNSTPFFGSDLTLYACSFEFDRGLLRDYPLFGAMFVLLFSIGAFVANYYKFKEKEIKA